MVSNFVEKVSFQCCDFIGLCTKTVVCHSLFSVNVLIGQLSFKWPDLSVRTVILCNFCLFG